MPTRVRAAPNSGFISNSTAGESPGAARGSAAGGTIGGGSASGVAEGRPSTISAACVEGGNARVSASTFALPASPKGSGRWAMATATKASPAPVSMASGSCGGMAAKTSSMRPSGKLQWGWTAEAKLSCFATNFIKVELRA